MWSICIPKERLDLHLGDKSSRMEAVHMLRVMWKHKLLSACSTWHYTAVDGDCIAYVAQGFMLMGQVGVLFYLSKMSVDVMKQTFSVR